MTLTVSGTARNWRIAQAVAAELPSVIWNLEPAVSPHLTEVQVGWGEDTKCSVCLCDLPAGATAFEDGDGVLCVDCSAAEGTAA